jgi:hypothetical protein
MARSFSTGNKVRTPAQVAALMRNPAARAAAAAQGGNAGAGAGAGGAGQSGLQPGGTPLPIDYAAIAQVLGVSEQDVKDILNASGIKHKGKGAKDPKEKPADEAGKEQKKAQEKPWWMKNGPGLNALLSLGSRGAGLGMPEGSGLPDNGAGALLDPEKLQKRINKLKASGKLPPSFPSNPPPAPSAPTK